MVVIDIRELFVSFIGALLALMLWNFKERILKKAWEIAKPSKSSDDPASGETNLNEESGMNE